MSIENLRLKFNQLTLESEDHWDYRGNCKSERDYVHGFCTYPAMMVPKMQREILEVCLAQSENKRPKLLDPFAGSGTILVEGMLQGLDIVGVDVNPLAVLLCKAKTTIINPEILKQHTTAIKGKITELKKSQVVNHSFDGIEKWFTEQAIVDLSIIRRAVMEDSDINIRRFFWATFCEVVRIVSNSRDCTYKLHIKEKSETLCESIPQVTPNSTDIQNNLLKVRKKELYDVYVNKKHSEISTGDIFIIGDKYYILVTQSCDTFLRKDGKRKLENAILLNIVESPNTCYKYNLSCFCDRDNNFKHPAVIFRNNSVMPFEILDLCVTNDDGKSYIDISCFEGDCLLDTRYTINYLNRYKAISTLFSEVLKNKQIIDDFLSGYKSEKNTEEIKSAFSYLLNCDSAIKNFEFNGSSLSFPVQRIARLNELNTIDLLKEYGNMSSRVGHPFDFMKKDEILE